MSVNSNEKNIVKPIVFGVLTIAPTNTKADIWFSEVWLAATGLGGGDGVSDKGLFQVGWEHSVPSDLLWWLSCASQPLPLSPGGVFVLSHTLV